MDIEEIIEFLEQSEGVLTVRPERGDGSPEIAWGDTFFHYAPDGTVPATTQPFATIVTKDYPDDDHSRLNRDGVFRLNVNAGRDAFVRWTGHDPREPTTHGGDASTADTVMTHPVYGRAGWLAIVNPGPHTAEAARELLRSAYEAARSRSRRRADPAAG